MEKEIKREILGYIVQICFILIFIVATYFIFTNSRIAQFASTAAAYDNINLDLSISYSQDSEAILNVEDTLDKGKLSIQNPNKKAVLSTVYLYVSKDAHLDEVEFIVDGNIIDTKNAEESNEYYVFPVYECTMSAFEKKYIDSEIKGDAFYTTPFSYMFDVEESFL